MKHSEELKLQRSEKVTRMTAILDGAKTASRAVTTEETTEFDTLKSEVTALDTQIGNAEFVESRSTETTQTKEVQVMKRASTVYNVGKAIREFSRGAEKLTGLEAEQHQELSRGIMSEGLLVPYSQRSATANDTSTHATSIDVVIAPGLSIIGSEPLYQSMGLTVLPGLVGTLKLGKKAADVAGKYAESAEVVAESSVPSFVTLAPERYGITDIFTKELLAQENPAVQAAIIGDMVKGCDRKLTAETYAVALAAATEVAAGAITQAGFDALMAAVDLDGAFAMDRGSFFSAKGVKIDSGSGIFLASLGKSNGIGVTHDGANLFYSTLFADGAAKQYLIYGAWAEIYLGLWGALEILINPYTYQKLGQIEMTVNKLADLACRNSAAFVKSPDLDSAT